MSTRCISHISKRYGVNCGTASTAVETGRYDDSTLNDRKCFNCDNVIEDEMHVILHCPLYDSFRRNLFVEITGGLNSKYDLT